jgi:hypothetical protein
LGDPSDEGTPATLDRVRQADEGDDRECVRAPHRPNDICDFDRKSIIEPGRLVHCRLGILLSLVDLRMRNVIHCFFFELSRLEKRKRGSTPLRSSEAPGHAYVELDPRRVSIEPDIRSSIELEVSGGSGSR